MVEHLGEIKWGPSKPLKHNCPGMLLIVSGKGKLTLVVGLQACRGGLDRGAQE